MHDEPEALWTLAEPPLPISNAVLRGWFHSDAADGVIEQSTGGYWPEEPSFAIYEYEAAFRPRQSELFTQIRS